MTNKQQQIDSLKQEMEKNAAENNGLKNLINQN